MSQLKDTEIRNIEDGKQKKESLGKGNGALVFRRKGNVITGYYCYWKGKKSIFIKLDNYKLTPKTPGKSSAGLRDQALGIVKLKKKIAPLDLKEYLMIQDARRERKQKEERRRIEAEQKMGTLEDLILLYTKSLTDEGKVSAQNIKTTLINKVVKPFPELATEKACRVTSDDLRAVFHPIISSGKSAMYNQVRANLSACFSFGEQFDYNPKQGSTSDKRFSIEYNPVRRFAKEPTKARKRELNSSELRQLWLDIDNDHFGLNSKYGLFMQFCFACFGNRPEQLARCKWSDVCLDTRTLTFINKKLKGEIQETVIPLTDRAIHILSQLIEHPQRYGYSHSQYMVVPENYIFSATVGRGYLNVDELGNRVREYNREKGISDNTPGAWWVKDFRRTCVSIMTRARIIKEHRYLLQSRSDGSVETKHYDVSDRMDEKEEAAERFDRVLNRILYGVDDNPYPYNLKLLKKAEATIPRFISNPEPTITDNYREFRQHILNTRELRCKEHYIKDGYSNRKTRRWFRQLQDDNVIAKEGRRYVLRPLDQFVDNYSEPKPKDLKAEYESFKTHVINAGSLKSQVSYIMDGYSDRKVKKWFKQLRAEGIIKKVGQRYHLNQPGDTYGYTPNQTSVSGNSPLQIPG